MKLQLSHTLKTISELIDCKFIGSPDFLVTGINEIHKVEEGDLVSKGDLIQAKMAPGGGHAMWIAAEN